MSKLNMPLFPEYTIDTLENIMSLRKPQGESVKILSDILGKIDLSKNVNLEEARSTIHDTYTIFSDFERSFMSLTFALATGVGKTKLMGAFMTYLYTNKGVKNFFVVAPNLTIYNKLKNDLGNTSPDNHKYVFKGVGCFATNTPNIWCDDDYRNRPAQAIGDTDSINIFIFNIDKFNDKESKMKSINEYLGQSFFSYLQSLEDLVLIMDESHHYRAEASAKAINDINPVLGLELTATPQVQSGSKTKPFNNVVYEYPLSQAIKDGYTRTPYALTRRDFKSYGFTEEELDKTMINDGVKHHENIKLELIQYANNEGARIVKPFMLIVCKDTKHAEQILNYVKSDAFREGKYSDKVIMVHSGQKKFEKEKYIELLLDVEKSTNPIEIVIHVNILKEGWDVNNLYTIVPLRTATSKTLREQTVGRGLRLPFGKRTGDKMIDSVTITAHDRFDEIIAEAQGKDSIFNADGVIYAEAEKQKKITFTRITPVYDDKVRGEVIKQAGLDHNEEENREKYRVVQQAIANAALNQKTTKALIDKEKVKEDAKKDLGQRFVDNNDLQHLLEVAFGVAGEETINQTLDKEMFIPKIKTEELGEEKYIIQDFDLDLSTMVYVPIANDILIRNLLNSREEAQVLKRDVIDFDTIRPEKYLVEGIRTIDEVDYEKCPEIIQKVVMQFLTHYRSKYSEEEVRNICLMYRKDIISKFKVQLLQHLAITYDGIIEVVQGVETIVRNQIMDTTHGLVNIYYSPKSGESIRSLAYEGAIKSITTPFKFDSEAERLFAIACDNSPEVIRWLRPAANQFNITYNRGQRYEPDFVVETKDMYYLVEVKAKNKLDDPDVLAKKDRAIKYCEVASQFNLANGHKAFKYLFIPHDEISTSTSFNNLKDRFVEE